MRQFLKQLFAIVLGTVVGLSLFSILGATSLVLLLLAAGSSEEAVIQDSSILVFDLSTPITDREPLTNFSDILLQERAETLTLRKVVEAIDRATEDDRIVGMFLDGGEYADGNPTGYATLQEVRSALERFRAAGKPIITYDVELGKREYYLASVADEVILNPFGGMEMNGLASEELFLSGALEKYGVGVQIIRVGRYKSAVEPLIQQEFSAENRQQIGMLLNSLWNDFIETIAQSREVTPQALQAIADTQGILLPQEAQEAGLIDRVAYFDEVVADLRQLTGEEGEDESFRQVGLSTYSRLQSQRTSRLSGNKLAVVYAEGSIVNGQGGVQEVGGSSFAETLREIRLDDEVKAVVLRINSPGGSVTASEVILREVQLLREQKPVIVSMGDVAASGGYWIATGAEQVFAQSNTITGSIGVFGMLFNVQEIANNQGITWDVVQTAELANSGTISRPKTAQELAVYQRAVDTVYDEFLERVAIARNLPKSRVAEIAQGRVWTGEAAKNIGLVDQLGGLHAAIEYAAERAELGEDWEVREYPESLGWETRLLGRFSSRFARQSRDPLMTELLKLREEVAVLQGFNDPRHVYVRMPFNFRVK